MTPDLALTALPAVRLRPRLHLPLAWLVTTVLALLLFRLWPELDLAVTAAVHEPGGLRVFPWGDASVVQAVYQAVPWLGRLAFVVCFVVCLRPRPRVPAGQRLRWRRRALALLLVLLLGLLGAVNGGLKEHVGRPRPYTVQPFGGPNPYLRVGEDGPWCRHNCSFVSGHAATGFTLMACGLLGGVAVRRRWAWIGAGAGALIGLGRVLQGGHFASDIVFAGLVMGGVCLAVRAAWVRRRWWRLRRERQAATIGARPARRLLGAPGAA